MEDANSSSSSSGSSFPGGGNASYSAFSLDYELFRNGTGDNRTDQNYSFPWQSGDRSVDDYSVEWEGSVYPSGYSHLGIILTSFFVTVIMILIVVGNMLVCIAIATEKALKTVQNWFIASLAVSDFLVGLIIMPFSLAKEVMGYWIFGRIWCEIHSALDVFLCTASINSLCLISLDRYWSVTHAVEYLRKRTPRRSFAMICGVWVLSAIISLPPLVGWKKPEKPSNYPECLLSEDVGYVLYSAFGPQAPQEEAEGGGHRAHQRPRQGQVHDDDHVHELQQRQSPDRSRDFEPFSQVPELPKIPESNGTRSESSPVVFVDAPEIVIENSDEGGPLPGRGRGRGSPSGRRSVGNEQLVQVFVVEHHRQQQKGQRSHVCREEAPIREGASGQEDIHAQDSQVLEVSFLGPPCPSRTWVGPKKTSAKWGRIRSPGRRRKKKKVKAPLEEVPKRQPTTEAERQKRRIAKAKERRATLILGLIMASFILAWLPFFVLYVLEALCKVCDIGPTGFAVAFWLGYCNSALNPIIYTIFNRDFRRAFRKILFK
ncbi:alpha-2A adrenergic receptor [Caerostris extrusa]|uniref:Alpha-2A adrenergic receptor n=1 Tax=Caerostris extrusa TaxID=172846 RepID=A0AAV4VEI9_CAEEX|nr:alpha-2A adrenergic receptor [Caerostris extrusa]